MTTRSFDPEAWIDLLQLPDADRKVVVETFPDPESSPDGWRHLEAARTVLTAGIPGTDPAAPIPVAPDGTSALSAVHVVLASLPEVVAFHRSRGVPDDVTAETLSLVGDPAVRRDAEGRIEGLDTSGWFLWRFRGMLYRVGVLSVIPVRLGLAPDSERYYDARDEHPAAPGHRRGEAALSIHLPPGAGLRPDAVRTSIDRLGPAFRSWFAPDPGPRIGTCGTWALDPSLRADGCHSSEIAVRRRSPTGVPLRSQPRPRSARTASTARHERAQMSGLVSR